MFYLLLASFLWGTSFIAGKFAYEMASPEIVVVMRLCIASVVMLPITYRLISSGEVLGTLPWKKIALLGVLTFPITFMLQFLGLRYTSAASAATMIGVEPLMVLLIGVLFFKERVSPIFFGLGTVAFLGVALVVGIADDPDVSLKGCLLVLTSTIVVAIWLRCSKQILGIVDAKIYTALSMQLGTLLGVPFILLFNTQWQVVPSISGVMSILYLGVGCSLLAGWFWNKGLERTSANTSGIFLALEPVFGVVMAVILLNENLTITMLIGIVLVVVAAGVSMILSKGAQDKPQRE